MRRSKVKATTAGQTDARPAHHANSQGTSFVNPWASARLTWAQTMDARLPFEMVTDHHPETKPVRVIDPAFASSLADTTRVHGTWIGHASVLVQLPLAPDAPRPARLLFDPMFSDRASPIGFAGPIRRLKPACAAEALPTVDFVFITHNHYDHLDTVSIMSVFASCGRRAHYVVPLGNRKWFEESGVPSEQIIELDWWDERSIDLADLLGSPETEGALRIVATPAQHNSGRGALDHGSTLWAGFAIEQTSPSGRAAVYNAGDTGYRAHPNGATCPAYKEVGELLGPFDMAFVPIWRGGSLAFFSWLGVRLTPEVVTQATHCTPEDAVALHKDVRARHTLAIHFATFAGSDDEASWPLDLLRKARHAADVPHFEDEGGFGYVDVGATVSVRPDA